MRSPKQQERRLEDRVQVEILIHSRRNGELAPEPQGSTFLTRLLPSFSQCPKWIDDVLSVDVVSQQIHDVCEGARPGMSRLGDPAPVRAVRLEMQREWGLPASVPTLCCFPISAERGWPRNFLRNARIFANPTPYASNRAWKFEANRTSCPTSRTSRQARCGQRCASAASA